jgi:hypothetical protein
VTLTFVLRPSPCRFTLAWVKPCARQRSANAATAAEWKSIAGQRLTALDDQIAQLQHARGLLAGALWCRFDHPATDCTVMGAEMDRRLDRSEIRNRPPRRHAYTGWRFIRRPRIPSRTPRVARVRSLEGPRQAHPARQLVSDWREN